MRIDVPSAGRLRGQDPIDLMSALTPVVEALRASDTDLSRVRVVCDWIQYRASFREPVDYRPVLAAGWQAGPDPGSPGRLAAAGAGPPETALEIAVDLRRAGADLGPQVIRLLAEHASPGGSARLPLESWGPGSESCIWPRPAAPRYHRQADQARPRAAVRGTAAALRRSWPRRRVLARGLERAAAAGTLCTAGRTGSLPDRALSHRRDAPHSAGVRRRRPDARQQWCAEQLRGHPATAAPVRDEPFLAGYPEEIGLAIEAINIVTDVPGVHWTLHVCYGNRYARPLWAGHYDFLFPAVTETTVDQLALEFARKGDEDLKLLEQYQWDRGLGLAVIDVKTEQVETREQVATRIRRALRFVPPERLSVNPDCGLRHLPPEIARAKLAAMVAGAADVRAELGGTLA